MRALVWGLSLAAWVSLTACSGRSGYMPSSNSAEEPGGEADDMDEEDALPRPRADAGNPGDGGVTDAADTNGPDAGAAPTDASAAADASAPPPPQPEAGTFP